MKIILKKFKQKNEFKFKFEKIEIESYRTITKSCNQNINNISCNLQNLK